MPSQRAHWKEQFSAATRGDVLHDTELNVANLAVTEYARSYGSQTVWEVRPAMQTITDRFPATPIAAIAALQMARAENSIEQLADPRLAESSGVLRGRGEAVAAAAADFTPVSLQRIRGEMARERQAIDVPASRGVGSVVGAAVALVTLVWMFRRRLTTA